MGQEDRDWFRERKINYEKRGLTDKLQKKHNTNSIKSISILFYAIIIFSVGFIAYYFTQPFTKTNVSDKQTSTENQYDDKLEQKSEDTPSAAVREQSVPETPQIEKKPLKNNDNVFTDKDLVKYVKSSDKSASPSQYKSQRPYANDNQQTNQANYESWCDAGTKCRDRITRANEDVKEAYEKYRTARHEYEIYKMYNGRMGNPYNYIGAESNLENAEKQLKQAKEDLSDLEEQAHSKDIKPGWLRCQE